MLSALPLVLAALAPVVQPVGEYERWQLSFDAKVEGEHVIENYPQYEKLFFCGPSVARYYGHPLAGWRAKFTDAVGKEVRQAANWGAFYPTVFSSRMQRYDDAFIVPPGAVQLEISFTEPNKDERLVVENVKLARRQGTPLCQDTGTLTFFVDESLRRKVTPAVIRKAVALATEKGCLRKNCIDSVTGRKGAISARTRLTR